MKPVLRGTCKCGTEFALYPYHIARRHKGSEQFCHSCWRKHAASRLSIMDTVVTTVERTGFQPRCVTNLAVAPPESLMLFMGDFRPEDGAIIAMTSGYAFWLAEDHWQKTKRAPSRHDPKIRYVTASELMLENIQKDMEKLINDPEVAQLTKKAAKKAEAATK